MALFQNTVISKYLQTQNPENLIKQWDLFQSHFHNPSIQENIRNSKEEQYQEGFLRDLFVNILGYKLNPANDFNLTTEYKNVKDSKKADGAILLTSILSKGEEVKEVTAIIELKGTNTVDLSKVEDQAFGYKNNQENCKYVITSNFEKLRFYVDNAIEHIEFNLFELTQEQFNLMYLILAFENIKNHIPKKLKDESLNQEDIITKKLYKDYSIFKSELFQNLTQLNPEYDPLVLFQKSQKLLDRLLFLLFGEDRGLLPPNSVREILKQWNKLQDLDEDIPLYNRYKKYFGYLNTGFKGKNHDVFAYNGGLFKEDEILDNIKIDDKILHDHTFRLSQYDFASEVDVNILGHIFENSLNEIDEIKAQLDTTMEHAPLLSKRKKDGVFYTPKYITKYIVENTVGKLCTEKKVEFEIVEEDYFTDKKRQQKTSKALLDKLDQYRDWLLQLTIVDPACGSGAFLNEALNFLIKEHQYIDELEAKLRNVPIIFSYHSESILEHNLFGVDLNEESVEIAKLSLWLRTAEPNRKLNSLNDNIKCGNSLIDDPEIAGDKAFNWQKEFPQVFKEKDKKTFHVTTALHDSRTSQRMIDYKVREKRFMGTMPQPQFEILTDEEELLITETIAEIKEKDNLHILSYNICRDHLHLLIVCEAEVLDAIMQKIKSVTARKINIHRGVTKAREHAPLSSETDPQKEREHAPLLETRGKKQNSLWTQKFGKKEIETQEQLWNTINYIDKNRSKHDLPEHSKELKLIIEKRIVCSVENAFSTEFDGGFDVVIGNPPYVKLESIKEVSEQLSKLNYETFEKRGDLYVLFVEKGFNITKNGGYISFIMPNKWLQAGYGESLRSYFLEKKLTTLIDFGDLQIFQGATTYPCIFVAEKDKPTENINVSVLNKNEPDFYRNIEINNQIFPHSSFDNNTWIISSNKDKALLDKLQKENLTLKQKVSGNAYYGLKTGLSSAFFIDEEMKNKASLKNSKSKEIIYGMFQGRDLQRYTSAFPSKNIILFPKGFSKSKGIETEEQGEQFLNDNYQEIFNWLLPFKENAKKRTDKGDYWWELRACDYYEVFSKPKIMYQKFQVKPAFIFDNAGTYCNDSMWIIPTDDKGLLAILNSKMGWWLISKFCTQIQNGYQLIWNYFGQIPIPNTTKALGDKADQMLSLNKDLQEISGKFTRTLTREHAPLLDSLPKKLQTWHQLSYDDFLKELKKQKVELTLSQKAEWADYFDQEKSKALEIYTQISATDQEIDQMVYELYGLNEEEIKIVETAS